MCGVLGWNNSRLCVNTQPSLCCVSLPPAAGSTVHAVPPLGVNLTVTGAAPHLPPPPPPLYPCKGMTHLPDTAGAPLLCSPSNPPTPFSLMRLLHRPSCVSLSACLRATTTSGCTQRGAACWWHALGAWSPSPLWRSTWGRCTQVWGCGGVLRGGGAGTLPTIAAHLAAAAHSQHWGAGLQPTNPHHSHPPPCVCCCPPPPPTTHPHPPTHPHQVGAGLRSRMPSRRSRRRSCQTFTTSPWSAPRTILTATTSCLWTQHSWAALLAG